MKRTSNFPAAAKRTAGWCKAVRGGKRRSPWSLLLKDDASRLGRLMPVTASACDRRRRAAVFRKGTATESGTAECFALCLLMETGCVFIYPKEGTGPPFRSPPLRHWNSRPLSCPPIPPLPRNSLAFSATGGALAVSPAPVCGLVNAAQGG